MLPRALSLVKIAGTKHYSSAILCIIIRLFPKIIQSGTAFVNSLVQYRNDNNNKKPFDILPFLYYSDTQSKFRAAHSQPGQERYKP